MIVAPVAIDREARRSMLVGRPARRGAAVVSSATALRPCRDLGAGASHANDGFASSVSGGSPAVVGRIGE